MYWPIISTYLAIGILIVLFYHWWIEAQNAASLEGSAQHQPLPTFAKILVILFWLVILLSLILKPNDDR